MKIITQLFKLALLLILVNADQYCDNLFERFTHNCTLQQVTIRSCCELKKFLSNYAINRVYKIHKGTFSGSDDAYCDMTTDGGGWIVIQRNRKNSLVNFNRNWTDYEEGFGNLYTDFWYGLESMHCLTQRGQWEMRVDYQFTNKTWSYLHYNQFSVGSASEEYSLAVGGFTGVGNTDWFNHRYSPLNRIKFSTPDKDNDKNSGNCAAKFKSGWWYNNCFCISINKQPPHVGCTGSPNAIFTEIRIRPKNCITQQQIT